MRDRQKIFFELPGLIIWQELTDWELDNTSNPPRRINDVVAAWRVSTIRGTATCGLGAINNVLVQYLNELSLDTEAFRKASALQQRKFAECKAAELREHIRSGAFGTVVSTDDTVVSPS